MFVRKLLTAPITLPLYAVGGALVLTSPVMKVGLLGAVPAIGKHAIKKANQIATGKKDDDRSPG